ncbi:Gfo/Idh/MocA family protein [Haploplasma axanthum]|uniref:Glucose--fructose oxidoreductase n=1 Tax=Haploplasma axanthum TaxID=29552 RepID=A0A449BD35_HAPAX|nr:Gfo/Idh/MocA family oxidoreductase [Haploplasma axanthum]VEU80220.1 Glucose--fructose oxidoreductase precursor [Haploplasma axanthum]
MKKIRWAICGLGTISKKFLKAIKLTEGNEVVACASSDKARAEKYAKKYGIKIFGTYEEIASSGEIDAVYICNNISDHYRCSKLFLSHNVAVLCEKAFTQNVHEAKSLIAYANEKNTLIMEAMWTKFLPTTQKIISIIESKQLGSIIEINGAFHVDKRFDKKSRSFDNVRGGGSVLDLAVYLVSYSQFLLGMPKEITVNGKVKNGVDLKCDVSMYYESAIAKFTTSSVNFFKMYLKIICEQGTIDVPMFMQANHFTVKQGKKVEKYKYKFKNGFQYEILHFSDLVRFNKKDSDVRSNKETIDVMEILTSINNKLGVSFKMKE